MSTTAHKFFTEQQQKGLKQAILNAELDTSGEIRLHIENTCSGDVMDRAALVFEKLNMHKTALRNGVLIYLAINNRKYAIIGDSGINHVVPPNFWDNIKTDMLTDFRQGNFFEGLSKAIEQTGRQLKKHFPYQKDDVNELPDDISFGDN